MIALLANPNSDYYTQKLPRLNSQHIYKKMELFPNKLEAFLSNAGNSHARESILMHRLIYDLQMAAAFNGYHLKSYVYDVDHNGYDLILDNDEFTKKIQFKSVLSTSQTDSWRIKKGILRPNLKIAEYLSFANSYESIGLQGGAIIINVTLVGSSVNIRYYSTDILIIMAFKLRIISLKLMSSQQAIDKLFGRLWIGNFHEAVSVPKSAFLEVKSPEDILALTGFPNSRSSNDWIYHFWLVANHEIGGRSKTINLPAPIDYLKRKVASELSKLTEEKEHINFFSNN